MVAASQNRAVRNYRARLGKRGLARFEVLGRDADRELVRSIAKRLAEDTPEATRLRAAVTEVKTDPKISKKGGIVEALLRSPLVGSGIDLTREWVEPREIDL
jgi:hypothetical protein